MLQAVEVVDGVDDRQVAVVLLDLFELAGRRREQQLVEHGTTLGAGCAKRGALPRGDLGDANTHVASGEHLGAERLGPAAGQVAELAGHEPDD